MKADDNKIDSLFRDKLEGMESELSPETIEKMDHYISWQRNRVIFRRLAVAAGLVIIMVSVPIFLKFDQTSRKNHIAANVIKGGQKEIPVQADSKLNKSVQPKTDIPQTIARNQKSIQKQAKKTTINIKENYTEARMVIDSLKQAVEPIDIKISDLPIEIAIAENKPAVKDSVPGLVAPNSVKAEIVEKPAPVVIEYIVENKSAKPIKEKTGIAGLFKKAKEIGNEVSYGELRGWKDELFALNFIKSKKENNDSK